MDKAIELKRNRSALWLQPDFDSWNGKGHRYGSGLFAADGDARDASKNNIYNVDRRVSSKFKTMMKSALSGK